MNCPKCDKIMENGFSNANGSISWINNNKLSAYIFKDEDLSKAGWKNVFPWKAYYYHSFRCEQCNCILIDYSRKLTRKEIETELLQKS